MCSGENLTQTNPGFTAWQESFPVRRMEDLTLNEKKTQFGIHEVSLQVQVKGHSQWPPARTWRGQPIARP
jgi:hypothetical protein